MLTFFLCNVGCALFSCLPFSIGFHFLCTVFNCYVSMCKMYVFIVGTRVGETWVYRCERSVFFYFNLYRMNKVDKQIGINIVWRSTCMVLQIFTDTMFVISFCDNFNVTKNHLGSFSDILTSLDKFPSRMQTLKVFFTEDFQYVVD